MTITAKYASKCPACGAYIQIGSKVQWAKGSPAAHVACPAPVAPAARPVRTMVAAWGQRPSGMSRRQYEFSRDDDN